MHVCCCSLGSRPSLEHVRLGVSNLVPMGFLGQYLASKHLKQRILAQETLRRPEFDKPETFWGCLIYKLYPCTAPTPQCHLLHF